MRKFIISGLTLVGFAASSAVAGTLTEPEVEETVEEAAAASSSSGILIPLLLLLAVGAAVASSDSDTPAPMVE